jgi:hypothetical protein
MSFLVIVLFISVFATEYLAKQLAVVHPYFILLPEALSGIALLAIFGYVLTGRRWMLDWRYGIFLALYLFVVGFGFVAQEVPAGPVVAGLRTYLKFLPFFLLPAIYPFSTRQLKVQAVVLLTLLAIQSPLAVYQRFVQFADQMHTGDPIRGMTTASGVLTTLTICAIVVVVVLYLRRKLSFPVMLGAVAVFLLPATLNETKSTLILLPIAVLLPPLFMPRGSRALRQLFPVVLVGCAAALAFMTVYNHLIQNRGDGQPIERFFADRGIDEYLYTGAADGEEVFIGRVDSIVIAVERLAEDPLALAFGLGAGNVSKSFLRGFDGTYAHYYQRFGVGVTQATTFLWEIGAIGVATYLLFYFLVWQDARFLARQDTEFAILGQIWATVVVIMGMALFYNSVFAINETGYLFWFYSGLVAGSATLHRRRSSRAKLPSHDRPASWLATPEPAPASRSALTYRSRVAVE